MSNNEYKYNNMKTNLRLKTLDGSICWADTKGFCRDLPCRVFESGGKNCPRGFDKVI